MIYYNIPQNKIQHPFDANIVQIYLRIGKNRRFLRVWASVCRPFFRVGRSMSRRTNIFYLNILVFLFAGKVE